MDQILMHIWVVGFTAGVTAGLVFGLVRFTRWSQQEEPVPVSMAVALDRPGASKRAA